jgi:hypothetical protein
MLLVIFSGGWIDYYFRHFINDGPNIIAAFVIGSEERCKLRCFSIEFKVIAPIVTSFLQAMPDLLQRRQICQQIGCLLRGDVPQ